MSRKSQHNKPNTNTRTTSRSKSKSKSRSRPDQIRQKRKEEEGERRGSLEGRENEREEEREEERDEEMGFWGGRRGEGEVFGGEEEEVAALGVERVVLEGSVGWCIDCGGCSCCECDLPITRNCGSSNHKTSLNRQCRT